VTDPWLVVVDMQHAFGDAESRWAAPAYAAVEPVVLDLRRRFAGRVVHTRFVHDGSERGVWAAYYDDWPEFRVGPGDPVWDLTTAPAPGDPVVDVPAFGKWGPGLEGLVGDAPLVVCGVATECCVLATVLAAADAGRAVTVVRDACAGGTAEAHEQALAVLALMTPLVTVADAASVRGSVRGSV
jgi:nicotinamidase-related amidase